MPSRQSVDAVGVAVDRHAGMVDDHQRLGMPAGEIGGISSIWPA